MKKILSVLLISVMTLCLFTGCARKETPTAIRVGGLTGPTSMGMVYLLNDAKENKTFDAIDYTLAGTADELTPKLLKGDLDILCAPVNLASVLYAKSEGQVQLSGICALGVLYVVENGGETVQSLADLAGKTVYCTGKGSTPEYTLTYLLQQAGLTVGEDVTLEFKSEPAEIVALMGAGQNVVAMLPQPYVSAAQLQVEDLRVALDLTEEWDKLDNSSSLVTAGILVRKAFAEANPEAVDRFLAAYAESVKKVNDDPEAAAPIMEEFGIVKAAVAKKAIPQCNLVCVTGKEMKTLSKGYLEALFSQAPQAVGGAVPGDDFWYHAE